MLPRVIPATNSYNFVHHHLPTCRLSAHRNTTLSDILHGTILPISSWERPVKSYPPPQIYLHHVMKTPSQPSEGGRAAFTPERCHPASTLR